MSFFHGNVFQQEQETLTQKLPTQTQAAATSPALTHFTCITCRVAFKTAEIQRAHYKTDWHRYNLKRKVAELPPVSAETFQEKVLAQREAMSTAVESTHQVCEDCRKHFTSRNSYESHLRSRKHRETAAAAAAKAAAESANLEESSKGQEEGSEGQTERSKGQSAVQLDKEEEEEDIETETDSEPEPLELTECLFCPHESADMEKSLSHMSKTHGFFIPELDYLVDIKGLLSYLCEKVGMAYMCLYCNEKGKTFHSVESVQQHMVDKCHCKIFFEGDSALEYAEYYDYSKSYPDHKEVDKGGDSSEGDSAQDLAVPDTSIEVNEDLELVLPSGSRAGHRAMKLYYKQRLPTIEQRKSALISRLMSQYRALGWRGSGKGEGGVKRERDEAWARRMQKTRDMKLSVKANKMQPHFRPQVVF